MTAKQVFICALFGAALFVYGISDHSERPWLDERRDIAEAKGAGKRAGREHLKEVIVGSIQRGQLVSGEVRFKNEDVRQWAVERTGQECGCVRFTDHEESALPGEELVLRFQVNTLGQPLGPLVREIFAELQDSDVVLRAKVVGEIVPGARMEPQFLQVEADETGEFVATGVVIIPITAREDWRFVSAEYNPAFAETVHVDEAGMDKTAAYWAVEVRGRLLEERVRQSVPVALHFAVYGKEEESAEAVVWRIEVAKKLLAKVSPTVLFVRATQGPAQSRLTLNGAEGGMLKCVLEPPSAGDCKIINDQVVIAWAPEVWQHKERWPTFVVLATAERELRVPVRVLE